MSYNGISYRVTIWCNRVTVMLYCYALLLCSLTALPLLALTLYYCTVAVYTLLSIAGLVYALLVYRVCKPSLLACYGLYEGMGERRGRLSNIYLTWYTVSAGSP